MALATACFAIILSRAPIAIPPSRRQYLQACDRHRCCLRHNCAAPASTSAMPMGPVSFVDGLLRNVFVELAGSKPQHHLYAVNACRRQHLTRSFSSLFCVMMTEIARQGKLHRCWRDRFSRDRCTCLCEKRHRRNKRQMPCRDVGVAASAISA